MDRAWWGVVAVVVIGGAVVFYGWLSDRRRHRRALDAAGRPTREIPGLPTTDAPAYVQESDLARPAGEPAFTSADEDALRRRPEAATLPGGAAEGGFLNHADKGLAILHHPDVLVLAGDVVSDRDANALLAAAKRRGRPLVIVTGYVSEQNLATLRANALTGRVRTLPVLLSDAAALRRAVALTGGRLVAEGDLAAGWLPEEAWGTCDAWIADLDDSWVAVAGRSKAPDGTI